MWWFWFYIFSKRKQNINPALTLHGANSIRGTRSHLTRSGNLWQNQAPENQVLFHHGWVQESDYLRSPGTDVTKGCSDNGLFKWRQMKNMGGQLDEGQIYLVTLVTCQCSGGPFRSLSGPFVQSFQLNWASYCVQNHYDSPNGQSRRTTGCRLTRFYQPLPERIGGCEAFVSHPTSLQGYGTRTSLNPQGVA